MSQKKIIGRKSLRTITTLLESYQALGHALEVLHHKDSHINVMLVDGRKPGPPVRDELVHINSNVDMRSILVPMLEKRYAERRVKIRKELLQWGVDPDKEE